MDIRNIDLNLMLAFDALFEERSVSRAAARQRVSQPAMSAALAKLRDLFQDPLFIRASNEMVPTARALEIASPIHNALREIVSCLEAPAKFEPVNSPRTFRLQGTDYVEAVLLPPLMQRMLSIAPKIKIIYRPPAPTQLAADLEQGHLDMGIGYIPNPMPNLRAQLLFRDSFVFVARNDHPKISGSISLMHFADLLHIQVLPRDSEMYATPVDDALSKVNIVRNIALWVPSFLNVLYLVSFSDMVAIMPKRIVRKFCKVLPIQEIAPPLDLPEIEVRMFWAERSMHDSGHRWLRQVIKELCQAQHFLI